MRLNILPLGRLRQRERSPDIELRKEADSSDLASGRDQSSFVDRSLLPVADQHVAARGRKFWTVFLEAGQNGKIALIQQLAAETPRVQCASLLFLFCTAMRKRAGRNRNRQQDQRQEEQAEFVHCEPPSDFHHCSGYGVKERGRPRWPSGSPHGEERRVATRLEPWERGAILRDAAKWPLLQR